MGGLDQCPAMDRGHLLLLFLSWLGIACQAGKIKNNENKGKWGLTKDISWFRVDENDRDRCKHIQEDSLGDERLEGPPAYACQEDKERFCLCGKRGVNEKKDWKYMCGRCRKNEPFSFKVDLGKRKGKFGGKGKNKSKIVPGRNKVDKNEAKGKAKKKKSERTFKNSGHL